MTRDEIKQRVNEKQQRIIAAIQAGAKSRNDIVAATGLAYGSAGNYLRQLFVVYRVPNMACLRKSLTLLRQTPPPPFLAHNHVIIDTGMEPATAATELVQVLGREYCSQLADELIAACVPGATDEEIAK